MPLVREAFPNTFQYSTSPNLDLWDVEFLFNDEILSALVYVHETDQIAVQDEANRINQHANAMLEDIFALKELCPNDIVILDFLQFVISAGTLNYFSNQHILGSCFDWICNSLSNQLTLDGRCNTELIRISEFGQSEHQFIQKNFTLPLSEVS